MNFLGLQIATSQLPDSRRNNILDEKFWPTDSALVSASGAVVGPSSATRSSDVYKCVNVIAQTVASLPLIFYKRLKNGGKERDESNPYYKLFRYFPSRHGTLTEWLETLVWNLMLRGNAFFLKEYQGDKITGLEPLHPDKVTIEVNKDGSLVYVWRNDAVTKKYTEENILHIRNYTEDGIIGKGPIQMAREAIGVSLSIQDYNSQLFKNGVRLSGVLEHPGKLDDPTAERLAKGFKNAYAGTQNAGKVAILEEGMKYNAMSMTMQDAQFIEGRKFSRTDIAGLFRVPPHMIGDLERATFSNIEHQSIDFVVHCIRPHLVRIEQAIVRDVFEEGMEKTHTIEFLVDALLRGDIVSRYGAYQIALQNGFQTFNEIREMENKNPFDWGDATMVPLNMKVIDEAEDLLENDDTEDDQPEEEAPSEDEAGLRAGVIKSIREQWRPLFVAAFGRVLNKEKVAFNRNFKNQDELDARIKSVFDNHAEHVAENLEPLCRALEKQVWILCDITGRSLTRSALPESFVFDYSTDYCNRRFDESWGTSFATLSATLTGLIRTRPETEADAILERALNLLIGDNQDGHTC